MTTPMRRHVKLNSARRASEPDQCATCLQLWPCEVAQLQTAYRDVVRRLKEIVAGLADDDEDDETATTNVIPIIQEGSEYG